ncbi:MAG: exodeoxyribonuclease VII small subunit [Aureliella sp.]
MPEHFVVGLERASLQSQMAACTQSRPESVGIVLVDPAPRNDIIVYSLLEAPTSVQPEPATMPKKKKAKIDSSESDVPDLGFEDAMSKLEEIVERLESGTGTLDESLEDYSNAVQLMKACHKQLESAERKIEILSGLDAEGNPVTEPFDSNSTDSLTEKQEKRSQRRSAKQDPELF